jgi:hypothetical protein
MNADRGHVHHLLLRSGWGVRRILFVLYALSALFGALALWTREASTTMRWTLWIGLLVGAFLFLRLLEGRVRKREEMQAGSSRLAAEPSVGSSRTAVRRGTQTS